MPPTSFFQPVRPPIPELIHQAAKAPAGFDFFYLIDASIRDHANTTLEDEDLGVDFEFEKESFGGHMHSLRGFRKGSESGECQTVLVCVMFANGVLNSYIPQFLYSPLFPVTAPIAKANLVASASTSIAVPCESTWA